MIALPNKFTVEPLDNATTVITTDDKKHTALFTPNKGDWMLEQLEGVGAFLGVVEESADDAGQFMPLDTLQTAVAFLTKRNPLRVAFITRDYGDGERSLWACEVRPK